MDISFKKIELEDQEQIDFYLKKKAYRSCDLVFANIYLWSRKYPTQYAIVEDALVFQGRRKAELDISGRRQRTDSQSIGCDVSMVQRTAGRHSYASGSGAGI